MRQIWREADQRLFSALKHRPAPASIRRNRQDGRVLGVFADCAFDTRVVTVIDTVTDHPCGPC